MSENSYSVWTLREALDELTECRKQLAEARAALLEARDEVVRTRQTADQFARLLNRYKADQARAVQADRNRYKTDKAAAVKAAREAE